jgi:hypothetical protein
MDADLRELAEILAKAPRENNLTVIFYFLVLELMKMDVDDNLCMVSYLTSVLIKNNLKSLGSGVSVSCKVLIVK